MPKRTFNALTGIAGMSDEQIVEHALSNWHKVNRVLRLQPSLAELQRLLYLELRRGSDARANFIERLRGAIITSRSRASRRAVDLLEGELARGQALNPAALRDLGLDEMQIDVLTQRVND